jgi:hypothetical protein
MIFNSLRILTKKHQQLKVGKYLTRFVKKTLGTFKIIKYILFNKNS